MATRDIPISWLVLLGTVLIGLIGVISVWMIAQSWRRFDNRMRPRTRPRKPDQPHQDLWKLSGQRLADRLDQTHDEKQKDPDGDEKDAQEEA